MSSTPSSSESRIDVPRFNGLGNYAQWQIRMEDYLATSGYWDALQTNKPVELSEPNWHKLHAHACSTIRLCVSDDVVNHIKGLKTPKAVFEKMESLYQSKSRSSNLYVQQRFYALRMKEGGDLMAHLTVFNNLLAEVSRLGLKIDDDVKAVVLLNSLPSSYDHLVTTLTYGKDEVSLDSVSAALMAHVQRANRAEEEGGGSGDGLFARGGADRGRDKGKGESSGNKKKSKRFKSKDRSLAECFQCKQKGHWKRDCPNRGGSQNTGTAANIVQTTEASSSEEDMLSVSSTKCTEAWILDSGCSYHITPHR